MDRVLIVEDDPMVGKINKNYIESVEGFQVVKVCKDEIEALSYLKKNPVDLIILDVYLPRGDGLSILNKLRKEDIESEVIMVTASGEVDKIDHALKLGVIDYLVKPFEYKRLKEALKKYSAKKSLLSRKNVITQEDIDKLLNRDFSQGLDIQKGLNKYTLNSIINFFQREDRTKLSAEEISEELDISKVTVRRYMDYLEEIGYIFKEAEYGAVGRPQYLYTFIKR
ncbi:MAG: response regulator [Tissierellaceae bacterium]